jgi:predicted small secreted protein
MADLLKTGMFIKDLFRGEVRDALNRVHEARKMIKEVTGEWIETNIEIEDDDKNVIYRIVYDAGSFIPHIEPPLPPDQPAEPTE